MYGQYVDTSYRPKCTEIIDTVFCEDTVQNIENTLLKTGVQHCRPTQQDQRIYIFCLNSSISNGENVKDKKETYMYLSSRSLLAVSNKIFHLVREADFGNSGT